MKIDKGNFNVEIHGDNTNFTAEVKCTYDDDIETCSINLSFLDKNLVSSGSDFFQTFEGIREQLKALGFAPYCYGSSIGVLPSRMARQSSKKGLISYRHYLGEKVDRENMVHIFDSEENLKIVDVAEQNIYMENWMNSLKDE